MAKARRLGVSTPALYAVDPLLHTLTLEYVEGPSVKDVFLDFGSQGFVEERMNDIAIQIGSAIGKLHDGGLVHGDLTTSNMLIRNGTNQLVGSLTNFFFNYFANSFVTLHWRAITRGSPDLLTYILIG